MRVWSNVFVVVPPSAVGTSIVVPVNGTGIEGTSSTGARGPTFSMSSNLAKRFGWSGLLMLPITDGSLLSPFRSSNAFCSALCVKPIGGSLAIENIRSYRCPREPASPPKLSGSLSINWLLFPNLSTKSVIAFSCALLYVGKP